MLHWQMPSHKFKLSAYLCDIQESLVSSLKGHIMNYFKFKQ